MVEQGQQLNWQDLFQKNIADAFSMSNQLSVVNTLALLGVSLLLGIFVYYVYKRTFRGVLYSQSFNISLVLLTLITSAVIRVIASNIYLSLGMVGALSIVRFRTAVKDPMDTVYMFWAIGLGIMVGANYVLYAVITAFGTGLILFLMQMFLTKKNMSYLLVVHYDGAATADINYVLKQIKTRQLKSKTVSRNGIEATFEVNVDPERLDVVSHLLGIQGVHDATLVSYQNETM